MPGMSTSAVTPVIPGFYPDPTVCRVGDDYYLANSSFEYFPGAPIFHSRDLVTWRQIGNILTTREQFVEGDARPSQGIYGSTLRFHDGRFFFITTNVSDYDGGQLIVTATDPAGPWSTPVRVPQAIGIDPDLCWDGDRCLLTWKALDFDSGVAGIYQAPIDLATGDLTATPYPVWQGSGMAHAEGPHLYRIGSWWYLVLAEGGTERGHSVTVARATAPEGPYEACPGNPIFTRRSTSEPVQSVGHADLVEGPDGWAAVHLGTRPRGSTPSFHVLGRETFLAGVEWVDGWPVIVADQFEVAQQDTGWTDTFSQPQLDDRWVVPHGDLTCVARRASGGLSIPASRWLCTRVRDLRWHARASVERSGGMEVRIDPRHAYGVVFGAGAVRAYVRIGGIETQLAAVEIYGTTAELAISAMDPDGPTLILGDAGPDDIVLGAVVDGEHVELARVDGRYLSTEVAAGFTGRMLALGSRDAVCDVSRFTYAPA
jgi:hypothetical protein